MKEETSVNRREAFKTMGVLSVASLVAQVPSSATLPAKSTPQQKLASEKAASSTLLEVFSLDGKANIVDEENSGIINGYITTGVNYRDVLSISGLFAPPYASSDFTRDPIVRGKGANKWNGGTRKENVNPPGFCETFGECCRGCSGRANGPPGNGAFGSQ